MSSERTDAVLASIDGALADAELPDAMRWSPEPEAVKDASAVPYDGEIVPLPPQRYERGDRPAGDSLLTRRWIEVGTAPAEAMRGMLDGISIEPPDGPPQMGRARCTIEPVFSDHRPPPALDLNWSPGAAGALAAAVAAGSVSGAAIRAASEADARRAYEETRAELLAQGRPLSMREALLLRMLANPQEAAQAIDRAFHVIVEAVRPVIEEFGRGLAEMAGTWREAISALDGPAAEPAEPAEDARARALRLRRERGTGPDRQIQHRPGPRRLQP